MDSKDPKAKCSNYGAKEKYDSFSECFSQKMGLIFTEFLGCVPPLFGENDSNICTNIEPDHVEKLDYLLSMISDYKEAEGCQQSCHTLTIISTKDRGIEQDTNSLNIILEPTVTTYTTSKSSDMFTVLLEVGSSLGLWLGFGVLQTFDCLFGIWINTFQLCKEYFK